MRLFRNGRNQALRIPREFELEGQRNAFINRLESIENNIAAGNYEDAVSSLEALRRFVDGCGWRADRNDWIIDCAFQIEVRDWIDVLIRNLRE